MLDQLKATTRFENDREKSRLIIEMVGDPPIIDFQVDMIRNNRIPGLLPLELRRVDSAIRIYYDVTGKWRLKDLLDKREFSGQEFVALLEKFIQTISGSEAYLLDAGQFVLDEAHVFIDGNMEPQLLYMPVKGTQNINNRFKDLLLQLIIYRARLKDQDSGPILSGILNYLKRDDFNLHAFQKNLRTFNASGTHTPPGEPVVTRTSATQKSSGPVSLENLIPSEDRTVPPVIPGPKIMPKVQGSSKHPPRSQEKAQAMPVPEYKTVMRYRPSVVVAALLFQGVLAAGVIFGFGPVYAATEDLTTAYGAMGLMVLCLDGLVLKNLLKAENKTEVMVPAKRKEKTAASSAQSQKAPVQPAASQPYPVNFDKQVISNACVGVPNAAYDTELLIQEMPVDSGSYDTEVLTAQPTAPYLVRKGPIQEIIRLKPSAMVLGRQADMADHVISDPAIGRMHAELSWLNNVCQIRDMNSKNGTFVNGQRLAGPEPVNIFVGDEIRLGSLEYTLAQD